MCVNVATMDFKNEDGVGVLVEKVLIKEQFQNSTAGSKSENLVKAEFQVSPEFPPQICSDLPKNVYFYGEKNCDKDDDASDGWSEFCDDHGHRWEIPVVLPQRLHCNAAMQYAINF